MTRRATPADWVFFTICGAILFFLVFPSLVILPISFSSSSLMQFPPPGFSLRWYESFLGDRAWLDATFFSLQIAVAVSVCATVIGIAAAIALVRGRVPGRDALEALMLAPLIVPHIIVAIAVYAQFAPLGLTGTHVGFVLIHTALAVPYVVLIVSAALQRVPPSFEMAALNLGASRWRSLREITLPLIAPAVAGGAVFAFLASFDETVVSFFISGVEHKTVTRKLLEDIEFNLSPIIASASTLFVVATVLLMWLSDMSRKSTRSALT